LNTANELSSIERFSLSYSTIEVFDDSEAADLPVHRAQEVVRLEVAILGELYSRTLLRPHAIA
jgi:hypothetical protein